MVSEWADPKYADPDIGLHAMRRYAAKFLSDWPIPESDVYQFGVWCGHSMVAIPKIWSRHRLPIRKMFGLDSFVGLPKETAEPLRDAAWFEGNFSAAKDFGVATAEEAIALVYARLDPLIPTVLVPGFWDKVLTDDIVAKQDMLPAGYIDIDCDLYTSAVLALDFMFRNKLYSRGTVIGYHDWGSGGNGGEQRAHNEMTAKHGVRCSLVWEGGGPVLFRVV